MNKIPKKTQEMLLSSLDITTRTRNQLKYARLKTISDLEGYSESDLLEIKNFGPVCQQDLVKALSSVGVRLEPRSLGVLSFDRAEVQLLDMRAKGKSNTDYADLVGIDEAQVLGIEKRIVGKVRSNVSSFFCKRCNVDMIDVVNASRIAGGASAMVRKWDCLLASTFAKELG